MTDVTPIRRLDPLRTGLTALNRLAKSPALDRWGLRRPAERTAYSLIKTGFGTATAASRAFVSVRGATRADLASRPAADTFDLTPTEEQQQVVEVVREFAAEQLRPVAAEADRVCATPSALITSACDLGVVTLGIPEEFGGLASERSAISNVLVAEALAHGDLGVAVACLAPAAVASAITLWGSADQQATYLPSFVSAAPLPAALTLLEPRAAFDPFHLRTTARPVPGGGYVLDGVKSLVPLATTAELFVVGAELADGGPALFLIESGLSGLSVQAEPAMGLRPAGMGRLVLDRVSVPATSLLTGARGEALTEAAIGAGTGEDPYRACVRLARLAWCALATGTAQAVVDYVIPYVNERQAFGEPISHRQGVAFTVADMAIETDGMRLVTYRAAARAEQGRDFAREVTLARRLATEHGMTIGSGGVQLLGGHGYVKEHPVERWYRDLRAIGVMEGVVLV